MSKQNVAKKAESRKVDLAALVKLAREAKGRAEAAAPGPWETDGAQVVETAEPLDDGSFEGDRADVCEVLHYGTDGGPFPKGTVSFIAHSRTDLPALADGVIAMADELSHLRLMKRVFDRSAEPTFGPFDQDPDGTVGTHVQDAAGVGTFLFGAMAGLLEGMGGGVRAENYVALSGYHPVIGRIECILQRVGKLSPHEARGKAERELARAVALLGEHGIPWDGATTFLPEPPADDLPRDQEHPWLFIDARVQPNELGCARCGARQVMPGRGTADVLQAVMNAFKAQHLGCQEGDAAEVSRSAAANGTGSEA